MALVDDHNTSCKSLARGQPDAGRAVIIVAKRGHDVIRLDEAQQRFAQRGDPSPHRAVVAVARSQRTGGMRVVKADDVATVLVAEQRPGRVAHYAGGITTSPPDAPRMPERRLPLTDERPALFDYGFRRGCTCQYCSS